MSVMMCLLDRGLLGVVLLALLLLSPSSPGALAVDSDVSSVRVENAPERPKALSLCELVSHPAQYHRRKVRIEGIYRALGTSGLYDLNCSDEKNWMAVELARSVRFGRKLDKLLQRDRRAKVVFEGVFFGPEPVHIDPKLPPRVKERLRGASRRYGHLDAFETMIRVTAVRYVQEVPSSVPW